MSRFMGQKWTTVTLCWVTIFKVLFLKMMTAIFGLEPIKRCIVIAAQQMTFNIIYVWIRQGTPVSKRIMFFIKSRTSYGYV